MNIQEVLAAVSGLVLGTAGWHIGYRRTKNEAVATSSPAQLATEAFAAQRQMLDALTVEVSALRMEVISLTSENHKLRNEVAALRLCLRARGIEEPSS